MAEETNQLDGIAIIGMAGRFPDAANVEQFWKNLCAGVESVTTFTDEQLLAAGVDARTMKLPNYVKTGILLDGVGMFDPQFFGFTPREAEVTDPQTRLFLECAWEALENAGYDPDRTKQRIGVFGGTGTNFYFQNNLVLNSDLMESLNYLQKAIATTNDYLATRVSYIFNLKGPSFTVQTACSTSLVATHVACQQLLNGECDVALAGGAFVRIPQVAGYLHVEGSPQSPDGHCRAFDASARGMTIGSGAGVIVLKRLADALEDGDLIRAVIRGSAINNDGAVKIGYTAPSVEGQSAVIAEAQAMAGVSADEITYIETHGTGTELGDPIEIAGLTNAFRRSTGRNGFCPIGSVKTNVGHLVAAAGVAGLIKTVMALEHRSLPPSLHFKEPNPAIDFANSPFYVQQKLSDWEPANGRRIAGVSSFGIGGSNAHVVVEEAPPLPESGPSREWQLLVLSAKSETALRAASDQLLQHLIAHPDLKLADAAYTLEQGRQVFENRQMLVCRDLDDAVQILEARNPKRMATHHGDSETPSVVFMFPGQGAQHIQMGADLYRTEKLFREIVDRSAEILLPHLGIDLRQILYPEAEKASEAEALLTETRIAQPALFAIEYALATLWMSWGIKPSAMIGHSIGEFVAACLAGVFSLEDALALVAKRGQLMQSMPRGQMLAVAMPEGELKKILPAGLFLAAVNGPSRCVVSGPIPEITSFADALAASGTPGTVLHTSHAFHSGQMDPILQPFAESVKQARRGQIAIPFVSNLTGTWISDAEAQDPKYWANHLRNTVRFADGIRELLSSDGRLLLEVGPGTTLSSLAKLQAPGAKTQPIIASLRHVRETRPDLACVLSALGQLWLHGVEVDWPAFYARENRRRVALPTYPFQRQRYWIEPRKAGASKEVRPSSSRKNSDIADWFYVPSWKRSPQVEAFAAPASRQNWLFFVDESGMGEAIAERIAPSQRVIRVRAGKSFEMTAEDNFVINPSLASDYERLTDELLRSGTMPQRIVHLWSVTSEPPSTQENSASFDKHRSRGFDSLLFLAQAFHRRGFSGMARMDCISNQVQEVIGGETLSPAKAALLGPCKVISQEFRNLACRNIDFVLADAGSAHRARQIEQLTAELLSSHTEPAVAYRGNHRWVQGFEPVRLANPDSTLLKERGVYLITGGLGKIGLELAAFLARNFRARLILLGRTALPEKQLGEASFNGHSPDAETSRRMKKVAEIEALGGEVMTLGADIANRDQMKMAMAAAYARFGEINGVFHCAGITGMRGRAFIPDADRAHCDMHFQPKVQGLLSLEEIFRDKNPDFVVLFSSLAAVLGGLSLAAYAGANQFMDTFAQSRNRTDQTRWISVNLDAWKTDKADPASESSLAEYSLAPAEGIEVLRRVLAHAQLGQVIVSTGDLQARIGEWVQPEKLESEAAALPNEAAQTHARPELRTVFVAAENEMERTITGIWESLFGMTGLGIHDNFFDLGGDSLLLLQVQAKIRELLNVNLSAAEMFQHPTIESLARRLSQPAPESTRMEATLDRAQLQRAALARQQQAVRGLSR